MYMYINTKTHIYVYSMYMCICTETELSRLVWARELLERSTVSSGGSGSQAGWAEKRCVGVIQHSPSRVVLQKEAYLKMWGKPSTPPWLLLRIAAAQIHGNRV